MYKYSYIYIYIYLIFFNLLHSSFITFYFSGAGDGTWGLTHTKQLPDPGIVSSQSFYHNVLVTVIKYADKIILKEKIFILSHSSCNNPSWRLRHQELGVILHLQSGNRRWIHVYFCSAPILYLSGPELPAREWSHP